MHVLISRPKADALELKQRIEALGHKASIAPLIEIELLPIAEDALDNAVGIIATSRNALAALANSGAIIQARKLPLYAVGRATAQYAHQLGFDNVLMGSGTAADLVPLISSNSLTKNGPLIHIAGDHLAFDLASALLERNIVVQKITAYRSVAVKNFPSEVLADLASGSIDAIILMSPRTAQTWSDLIGKTASQLTANGINHVCLSEAVANALLITKTNNTAWKPRIAIAASPDLDAVLAVIQSLANDVKTG